MHACNIAGLIFFEMFAIFYSRDVIPWVEREKAHDAERVFRDYGPRMYTLLYANQYRPLL